MNTSELLNSVGVDVFHHDAAADISIVCGDCLDVLPLLPDGFFDLVLTDPPYGIAEKWKGGFGSGWGKARVQSAVRNKWDVAAPSAETMQNVVNKADAAIVWGGNYFTLPPSRCWLVWNKPERGFTLAESELAWTNADNVVRVCDCNRSESNRKHPTQKPVKLFQWCLSLSWSKAARLILDPFAGSCTTAVAAKRLGRRCIAIELERKYCEIGKRRLKNEPMPLFTEPSAGSVQLTLGEPT